MDAVCIDGVNLSHQVLFVALLFGHFFVELSRGSQVVYRLFFDVWKME